MKVTSKQRKELRRMHADAAPGTWKLLGGEVRSDMGNEDCTPDDSVFVCRPAPTLVNGHNRVPNAYLIASMQQSLISMLDDIDALDRVRTAIVMLGAEMGPLPKTDIMNRLLEILLLIDPNTTSVQINRA